MEIFEEELEAINKKRYYIKPENFRIEYKKSQEIGKPTNTLIDYFQKIAIRYSSKYNNLEKVDVDGCVNYALFEAIQKWDKYDETRSANIFSFYTEMIKNDLTIHYNQLKKNSKRHVSIDVIFKESNK